MKFIISIVILLALLLGVATFAYQFGVFTGMVRTEMNIGPALYQCVNLVANEKRKNNRQR